MPDPQGHEQFSHPPTPPTWWNGTGRTPGSNGVTIRKSESSGTSCHFATCCRSPYFEKVGATLYSWRTIRSVCRRTAPLRLFDDGTRTDPSDPAYSEKYFHYLNRVDLPQYQRARDLLEKWFGAYPEPAKPDLRGRFRSSDDSQHIAAWWELYVFTLYRRLGYSLSVHPLPPQLTDTAHQPEPPRHCLPSISGRADNTGRTLNSNFHVQNDIQMTSKIGK